MLYSIAIELGDEKHAFGVVVPDITGCFSAGDTMEQAIRNAKEAIEGHLEILHEDNDPIPTPSSMATHMKNSEFDGWVWATVDIDLSPYLGKTEKINVTLPKYLTQKIDRYVKNHPEVKSRSNFLAEAAFERLNHLNH